ncbi:MAG TPA: hypothetical protein VJQ55_05460, partial [Candidatus Binatia bacterium]|nr:hypothetical protein [Candidatus Binatia bacterium]
GSFAGEAINDSGKTRAIISLDAVSAERGALSAVLLAKPESGLDGTGFCASNGASGAVGDRVVDRQLVPMSMAAHTSAPIPVKKCSFIEAIRRALCRKRIIVPVVTTSQPPCRQPRCTERKIRHELTNHAAREAKESR